MSILDFFDEDEDDIPSLIKRRRLQMVLHSYLYYRMDDPIITDDQWQKWADELTDLQEQHPQHMKIGCYDKEFKDWSGATGMHLPVTNDVHWKCEQLLRIHRGIVNNG